MTDQPPLSRNIWVALYLLPVTAVCGLLGEATAPVTRAALLAVLLVPVMAFWWRARLAPTTDAERQGGWVGLGIVLLAALASRLVLLDRWPLAVDNDASLNAVMLQHLMDAPYTPFTTELGAGTETSFFYLMGWCLEVFGITVWSLRLPAVLFGLLTLPCLFLLVRELAGRRAAVLAAALCAIAPWQQMLARSSKHSMTVMPVVCLTYYLLLRALRRGGWWRYLLAGALVGCGMHTYAAYRHGALAAVLFVVLWHLRGRRLGRPAVGLRSGAAFALAGFALLLLPMVGYVRTHGIDWLQPLMQNTSAAEAGGAGFAAQLIGNAARVGYHALFVLPADSVGLVSFVSVVTVGALGLVLHWRDDRCFTFTFLALTMIIPPMGARYHLEVPRRYVALVPVLFGVPAFALVQLWLGTSRRARHVFATAAAVLLAWLGVYGFVQLRDHQGPDWAAPHRESVLRATLGAVTADPALVAYLPAGYAQEDNFSLQYFFLHPRIRELPHNDPFLIDPAHGDILVVPDHTRLGVAIEATFRGATRVPLTLPFPRWAEGQTTVAWRIPAEALRDQDADTGWVAIPEDGRYVPRASDGRVGTLGAEPLRDGACVTLARGLVPFALPGTAPAVLMRVGGGDEVALATPVAAPRAAVFVAPRVRAVGALYRALGTPRLPVAWARRFQRHAQDVDVAGHWVYVAHLDRIHRLDGRTDTPDASWRLTDGGGVPIASPYDYEITPAKLWSVAVAPDGALVVSHRPERWPRDGRPRWVRRFGADGRQTGELRVEGGWREPLDVAVNAAGECAVADMRLGEVVVFGASGAVLARHATGRPVSVAWLGEALFVLDQAELSIVRIGADGQRQSQFVGRVCEGSRLQPAGPGRLVLTRPRSVRWYDDKLRLVAPAGDPAPLDARHGEQHAVKAAAWDAARNRLLVVDRHGLLHRYLRVPVPFPGRGIDLPAVAFTSGNLNRTAARHPGFAVDGGARPARAVWAMSVPWPGRYAVWVCYATADPRPFGVSVDGVRLGAHGTPTGGYGRAALRWERLGELVLEPEALTSVVVEAEALMPNLERLRLVPLR